MEKNKIHVSTILLYVVLAFSLIHLTFLLLSLLDVVKMSFLSTNFNYIVAFVLVAASTPSVDAVDVYASSVPLLK